MRTSKTTSKKPVKVVWNFAPQPPPPEMVTGKNGQTFPKGPHQPWAESDGEVITRVYCYTCRRYFKSYTEYFFKHGGMVVHHTPPKPKPVVGRRMVARKTPSGFVLKSGQVIYSTGKGVLYNYQKAKRKKRRS